jgi:hypothetical protein
MRIAFVSFLILSGCAAKPIKLDCEWEFIEVPPGVQKVIVDLACVKKMRELQLRCGK